MRVMTVSNKQIDKIIYSYSTPNGNHLEEENKLLKETVDQFRKELDKFKSTPLMICVVKDITGDKAIIQIPNGNEFYVENTSPEKIGPGDSVLVEQKNLTIIKKIPKSKSFAVESFVIMEKPTVTWKDI